MPATPFTLFSRRDVVPLHADGARILPAAAVVNVETDIFIGSGRAQAASVAKRQLDVDRRLEEVPLRAEGDARHCLVLRVDGQLFLWLQAEIGIVAKVVRICRQQGGEAAAFEFDPRGSLGGSRFLPGRGLLPRGRLPALSHPGVLSQRPPIRGAGGAQPETE